VAGQSIAGGESELVGFNSLYMDWVIEPAVVRALVKGRSALQGNIDPKILYCGWEAIEREVKRMCEEFRVDERTQAWTANLGHGITPGVDPEALRWFFENVHKYSVPS
jgi:uroporphyrinogen decarboxylase